MHQLIVPGSVAVVTGGGRGLGLSIVQELRTRGASVTSLDVAPGSDVVVDVTDPAAVRAAIDEVHGRAGRLDVVVANAGVGVAGLVDDLDLAAWDRCIDVNMRGTVHTLVAAWPHLRARDASAFAIVASLSGLVPTPLLTPYATTKTALVGLARSLRPEGARHGIRVTVACPGPVDTPMLDERSATPGTSVRRFLTAAAGMPLPAARVARAIVDGIERNRAVVTPGRARALWLAQRASPGATDWQIGRLLTAELDRAR